MNWKTFAPLAIAIVLGVVAAVAARFAVGENRAGGSVEAAGVSVVVAGRDIAPGEELKVEELTAGRLAGVANVPAEAFTKAEQVAGRVTAGRVVRGQAILESLLAPKGSGGGLQAMVPRGMRAITIEVTESSGVAGLLTPGCHVDVLATIAGPGQEPMTRTVVQDLKVTAVGQKTVRTPGEDKDISRTVTLIASPKDAEVLDLLASTGRPRLVLRSSRDDAPAATDGTTLSDVRGEVRREDLKGTIFDSAAAPKQDVAANTRPAAPAREAPVATRPQRTVSIIRGGVETMMPVPERIDGVMRTADTRDPQ